MKSTCAHIFTHTGYFKPLIAITGCCVRSVRAHPHTISLIFTYMQEAKCIHMATQCVVAWLPSVPPTACWFCDKNIKVYLHNWRNAQHRCWCWDLTLYPTEYNGGWRLGEKRLEKMYASAIIISNGSQVSHDGMENICFQDCPPFQTNLSSVRGVPRDCAALQLLRKRNASQVAKVHRELTRH